MARRKPKPESLDDLRERWLALLLKFDEKLQQAIEKLEPENADWPAVAQGLRVYAQQLTGSGIVAKLFEQRRAQVVEQPPPSPPADSLRGLRIRA